MATGKAKSQSRRSESKSSGSSSMSSKERKQANPVSRAYTTTKGENIQVLKNGTRMVNGVEQGKVATPEGTRMVMGNSGSSRLVKIGSGADAKYDQQGNYKKATYESPFKNKIQTTTGIRNRDTATQNKFNEVVNTKLGASPALTAMSIANSPTNTGAADMGAGASGGLPVPTVTETPSIAKSTTNADGTVSHQMSDGTSKVESAITVAENKFKTDTNKQIQDLDTQRAMFDKKIDRLMATNDRLYQSSLSSIKSTFDVRADSLRENYASLTATREKAGYQTDSFRYTPTHAEGLITKTENDMVMDLAELDAKEQSLILEATTAKEAKDWDALEMQMKMYDSVRTEKSKLTSDLLTAAQEQNRRIEAEAAIQRDIAEKVQEAEAKSLDMQQGDKAVKRAEAVAPVIAKAIAKMSDEEKTTYLTKKAKELGVDLDILESAIIDRSRADDAYAKSLIPKAKAPEKLTEGEKKTQAYSQLEQIMNSGVNPQGNGSFAYTDPNGFFTPQGFNTLISLARNSGLSKSDFLSEYGTYLDPDNYKQYKLTGKDIAELEG